MKRLYDIESGFKINDLTVISNKFKITDGPGRYYFNVQCKCGEIFTTSGSALRKQHTKSCRNCAMKKRSLNLKVNPQINQLYNHRIIQRCKKDNISYNLSLEEFSNIISKNCHYCNIEPREVFMFKKLKYINTDIIKANGIDRIDNNLGYTLDNVIPCCFVCNKMKSNMNYNDFINHLKTIINNHEQ